jgi:IclR family acetate operon transcriptional repressor
MIMSQLAPAQRRRLLEAAPLKQYTPNTVTDVDQIEEELKKVRRDGYALDAEEFLPGLVCAAVLVPSTAGISNLGIAVQAPVMRLTPEKALRLLPALRRAADAIGEIEADAATGESRESS